MVTNGQMKEDQTKLQEQVTRLTGECIVQLYANMQTVQDWLSLQAYIGSTAIYFIFFTFECIFLSYNLSSFSSQVYVTYPAFLSNTIWLFI